MIETENKSARCASARDPAPRLQVIGCGNVLAGDDSAGVEIVRRLRARGDCRCALRDLPHGGVELLESFEEADVILFLDAVSSGAPPGTVHLVPLPWPGIEPRGLSSLSSHGWGLAETLELARALGRRAPRLMLLGVEVAGVSLAAGRSVAVEEAIAVVVERFSRLSYLLMDQGASFWQSPHRFAPGEIPFLGEA